MAAKRRSLFNIISGMKMCYRMFFIYIVGARFPTACIDNYASEAIFFVDRLFVLE